MIEAFKYTFVQNAVIGAVLASIACGIIGTIIVEKKLVMMSGGIAHSSFGGIGLGYYLSIEPIIGGLLFSIITSIGIVQIKRKTNVNSDTIIGIFWAIGMALGILFIALTPGYPPDMTSYLFGDILTISRWDVFFMLIMDALLLFIISSLFHYWRAYLFDDEFSKTIGISVKLYEYILFILIACVIVLLIKIVGIILVIALLTLPPAISKMFSESLKRMMILSVWFGIVFCITGFTVSYLYDIPSGATIILVSGVFYFISILLGTEHNVFNKNK